LQDVKRRLGRESKQVLFGLNLMSESFAELFEESFASQQIKPGAIIKGTVVAVNDG
jgi:small subunit ribosomal protein S1